MGLRTRIADKTGALGSVASAMDCAACGHGLAARQLMDGKPAVCRPDLDDWRVDLAFRASITSLLRSGRLRTPHETRLTVRTGSPHQ